MGPFCPSESGDPSGQRRRPSLVVGEPMGSAPFARYSRAMSTENHAIVHELVDAWNRSDIDGVLALFDSACEVVFPPDVPEPGPFHGHAELRRWAEAFLAAWEFHHADVVEVVDTDEVPRPSR